MSKRSGSADLPLHGGRVPPWLGDRMTRLGAVIAEAIVHEYGRDELLRRLAHPFWFQSFGAVMGMDWHSSGITTSVIGALKRGLAPLSGELGIHVCGGRGRHSRQTPDELVAIGERVGFDGAALAAASRLVAKVDSAAVQDGFDLYLHGFIVADDGQWVVVQQGMNGDRRQARRYHWLSEGLQSFVDEPHAAIEGTSRATSSTSPIAAPRRRAARSSTLLDELGAGRDRATSSPRIERPPARPMRTADAAAPGHARASRRAARGHRRAPPARHAGRRRRMRAARTSPNCCWCRASARARCARWRMVAEVVHGAPCRFSDPARFSLAHGGKDRHPFPVPLKVYDHTIKVLKIAVRKAKLGRDEELAAIRRLDEQARRVELLAGGPSVDVLIADERERSHRYGGRSVFGDEPPPVAMRRCANAK